MLEGIRAPLTDTCRRCFRGNTSIDRNRRFGFHRLLTPLFQLRLRGVQRLEQQLAHLRRQAGLQRHAAVGLAPAQQVTLIVKGFGLIALEITLDPPKTPHRALDMRRRSVQRNVQQRVFRLNRRHPRKRAHLRIRQPAFAEGFRDLRQRFQGPGRAYLLGRRHPADPALPTQPLGATRHAVRSPALPAVELRNEGQKVRRGRVDVPPQLHDLHLQRAKCLFLALPLGHAHVGVWMSKLCSAGSGRLKSACRERLGIANRGVGASVMKVHFGAPCQSVDEPEL